MNTHFSKEAEGVANRISSLFDTRYKGFNHACISPIPFSAIQREGNGNISRFPTYKYSLVFGRETDFPKFISDIYFIIRGEEIRSGYLYSLSLWVNQRMGDSVWSSIFDPESGENIVNKFKRANNSDYGLVAKWLEFVEQNPRLVNLSRESTLMIRH